MIETPAYREFGYHGWNSLAMPLFAAAWAVFWTLAAILYLIAGFAAGQPLTSAALSLVMLLVGWGVFLVVANSHPTVWLGDRDLMISVIPQGRARIAYDDITDVRPFGGIWPGTVVSARRITPLHELYGLFYSRTPVPQASFVIGPDIDGHDVLLQMLRERAGQVRVAQAGRE